MNPVPIQGCTRTFVAPTNFNEPCSDLEIVDVLDGELPIMLSAWKPSEEEEITSLLLGACVILGVVGNVHPVVQVYVGGESEATVGE